jgi:hypothetical protein
MTRKEYDDCIAEAKKLWEEGLFTYHEYEAVVKITFDRMYNIKVHPRGYKKRRGHP